MNQKVHRIGKEALREAMKSMKSGIAVGPGDIPVELWKFLGENAGNRLFNLAE